MIKITNLNRFVNGKPEITFVAPKTVLEEFANSEKINYNDDFLMKELAREYKRTTGRYLFKDSRIKK